MRKLKIAKLLCLSTILLLTSNLLFSSISFQQTNTLKYRQKTQCIKFSLLADDNQSDLIFEEEPSEEFEDFFDFSEDYTFFVYSNFVFTKPYFVFDHSPVFIHSLPTWLKVRHILI